jgi:flagellar basal-body rod protein FlgF
MDEMIFVAMTGAKQTETAQAINSNNLANISTTGFRADLHAFSAKPIDGPGVGSRVNSVVDAYGTDLSTGAMQSTGRDTDVAIQGDGFFAVQGPDGAEAYTRRGDFRIDSGGLLVNGDGHLVIGEGGPVAVPPNASLTIGYDGTISIQQLGQGPEALSQVGRLKLVNPDPRQVVKREDGLFALSNGEEAPADATVQVQSGVLEGSNVNVAKTLVNMIELARRYEQQVNMIKTAEENADSAAQLMRVG